VIWLGKIIIHIKIVDDEGNTVYEDKREEVVDIGVSKKRYEPIYLPHYTTDPPVPYVPYKWVITECNSNYEIEENTHYSSNY